MQDQQYASAKLSDRSLDRLKNISTGLIARATSVDSEADFLVMLTHDVMFYDRVYFFDENSSCLPREIHDGATQLATIFVLTYVHRSNIYEKIGLTEQKGRWFSACYSREFFKVLKKLVAKARSNRMTRKDKIKMTWALNCVMTLLCADSFISSHLEMHVHLGKYVLYFLNKLECGSEWLLYMWTLILRKLVDMNLSQWDEEEWEWVELKGETANNTNVDAYVLITDVL